LIAHFRDHAPAIRRFRCELLPGNGSGSGAEVAIATVATLSNVAFEAPHDDGAISTFQTTSTQYEDLTGERPPVTIEGLRLSSNASPTSHGSPVAYEARIPVVSHSNTISSPGNHTYQSNWRDLARPQRPRLSSSAFPISHGSSVAYETRMPVSHSNTISSPGNYTYQSNWQDFAQPQRPRPHGGFQLSSSAFPISHGSPVACETRMPVVSHSNTISSPSAYTYPSSWQDLLQPQRPRPHGGLQPSSNAFPISYGEPSQPVYQENSMYTPSADLCPFPQCFRICSTPQDLERHSRHHLPHCIYCSQSGCNWTGYRRYGLANHMKMKHPGVPLPEQDKFLIYDADAIVKQLLNQEITAERANLDAYSLFQNKAVQLGKLGIWRG